MRFALADTVTVSLHFVCKTYLYSAPVGKWRNAPKGVFRFFCNSCQLFQSIVIAKEFDEIVHQHNAR